MNIAPFFWRSRVILKLIKGCVAVLAIWGITTPAIGQAAEATPAFELLKVSNLARFVNNRPLETRMYENIISGSAFFKEKWLPAILTLEDGKMYDSIPVKLDLLGQHLYFLDQFGAEKEIMSKVVRVQMTDPVSEERFVFVPVAGLGKSKESNEMAWCEALQSGSANLLKKTNKTTSTNNIYDVATKSINIFDSYVFYLQMDGQLYPLKRPKDLQPLLAKNLPSISSFQSTGETKEDQWASMVAYYNEQMAAK